MATCLSYPRIAPARLGLVRSKHNRRVSTSSITDHQTRSDREQEDPTLQALITRMAQGEVQAMSTLYDATISRVYNLVRRFAPDDASAQDVTQEVYLQAWQQAQRFDAERGAAIAWLLNLARSRALDAWRKLASSPVVVNGDMADLASNNLTEALQPLDFLDAADRASALHAALQTLPAAARQIISLAFFHDMSHTDISTHLRMPLGTVKSTLRRALLRLRDHLQHCGLPAAQLAKLELENTL